MQSPRSNVKMQISPWYKRVSREPQKDPTSKRKRTQPHRNKLKHVYLRDTPEKDTRNKERLMPMVVAASTAALVWRRAAEDTLPSLVDPSRSCSAAPRPLEVARTVGSTEMVTLDGLPFVTIDVGNVWN